MRRFLTVLAIFALHVETARAELPSGSRDILLHPSEGEALKVATIVFSAENNVARYRIEWDDGEFADHFLSMRPFKCLEGPEKLWCRVPYPYKIKREITADDLTDLEYDLMFVWKENGAYGIDLWNGVYYRLKDEDGVLTGRMHEIDMNVLAAPPEDGSLRPISEDDLEEADAESHWLPRLTIE